MELIEARGALKSSFVSEISMWSLSTQQQKVYFDDVFGSANVTCDDFSVDDLLDFSDKDFEEEKDSFSSSSEENSFNFTSFVDNNELGAIPGGELAVPVDEMENLEWLSQFVEDSGTEISLLCHVGNSREKTGFFHQNWSEPVIRETCFMSPVCRKPRGKRSRPSGRVVWSLGSPSVTSESSSTSFSSHGNFMVSPCVFVDTVQKSDLLSSVEKPPIKKQKRKAIEETGSESCALQMLRRCSHCQVHKTPQWRTGPLGPKTLCNACGVRFKSGRLFPEYRPACSPTFSQEVHSNSHRKVLEMRQKRMCEISETGLTPMLSVGS